MIIVRFSFFQIGEIDFDIQQHMQFTQTEKAIYRVQFRQADVTMLGNDRSQYVEIIQLSYKLIKTFFQLYQLFISSSSFGFSFSR